MTTVYECPKCGAVVKLHVTPLDLPRCSHKGRNASSRPVNMTKTDG